MLNNFAIGSFDGTEELNINFLSGHSSFNQINLNTKWIKKTSKEIGTFTQLKRNCKFKNNQCYYSNFKNRYS